VPVFDTGFHVQVLGFSLRGPFPLKGRECPLWMMFEVWAPEWMPAEPSRSHRVETGWHLPVPGRLLPLNTANVVQSLSGCGSIGHRTYSTLRIHTATHVATVIRSEFVARRV